MLNMPSNHATARFFGALALWDRCLGIVAKLKEKFELLITV